MRRAPIAVLTGAALLTAACGYTPGERALTGGAIGAGTGAILSDSTGGDPVGGAIIGGIAGAAIGAVTAPRGRYYGPRYRGRGYYRRGYRY